MHNDARIVWPANLDPQTAEGRKFLTEALVSFATTAITNGTVTGLRGFFKSIPHQETKDRVIQWLESHTPIRKTIVNAGVLTFTIPPNPEKFYDLDQVRLNSWWSIPQQIARDTTAKRPQKDQRPLTDRELNRKRLITAVDRFLADPTERTKHKLVSAINGIPMDKPKRSGSIFLSGGATGLKK